MKKKKKNICFEFKSNQNCLSWILCQHEGILQCFCQLLLGTKAFDTCSAYFGPKYLFRCKKFNHSLYCEGITPKYLPSKQFQNHALVPSLICIYIERNVLLYIYFSGQRVLFRLIKNGTSYRSKESDCLRHVSETIFHQIPMLVSQKEVSFRNTACRNSLLFL